jgi:hypothetical protein
MGTGQHRPTAFDNSGDSHDGILTAVALAHPEMNPDLPSESGGGLCNQL